ncbi:MAG: polymer-forming cytoskeletal protein [Spirochaetales bacterium]|nr:polymer-forming cytoskeletal protein [Spirochaetales bacterium]
MSDTAFDDCIVGRNVRIEGRLEAKGLVRIEGSFSGTVTSSDMVVITRGARVSADITAEALVIAGEYEGEARVRDFVRIGTGGRARAAFVGDRLVMEEGSWFSGRFLRTGALREGMAEVTTGSTPVQDPAVTASAGNAGSSKTVETDATTGRRRLSLGNLLTGIARRRTKEREDSHE